MFARSSRSSGGGSETQVAVQEYLPFELQPVHETIQYLEQQESLQQAE